MFVVPPTAHPNIVTIMGLDYYQEGLMGQLTVFSDKTSHTYVGEYSHFSPSCETGSWSVFRQLYLSMPSSLELSA